MSSSTRESVFEDLIIRLVGMRTLSLRDLGPTILERTGLDRLELRDRLRAAYAERFGLGRTAPQGASDRPRVLVVDTWIPTPDRDSGSHRMFHLMCAAHRAGFAVTFVPHAFRKGDGPYFEALRREGIEVPDRRRVVSPRHELRRRGTRYDLVILSRADIASRYFNAARRRAPRACIVYDTVDLHFVRERREAEVRNDVKGIAESERRRRQELGLAARADYVFAVSNSERDVLVQCCPSARVLVVSNIHQTHETTTPFPRRTDLVFLGGFLHTPNVDAVRYFAAEVWPRVQSSLPDARFVVIGSDPPESIRELAGGRIVVTGYVPDLTPLLEKARVSVAPLRYGAGVKGKINTAMSHGVPVVTTSLGAEGMQLSDGEDVLLADEPTAMADAIVRLWNDEALWKKLVKGGYASIERCFSHGAAEQVMREIRDEIASARGGVSIDA